MKLSYEKKTTNNHHAPQCIYCQQNISKFIPAFSKKNNALLSSGIYFGKISQFQHSKINVLQQVREEKPYYYHQ